MQSSLWTKHLFIQAPKTAHFDIGWPVQNICMWLSPEQDINELLSGVKSF